MRHGILSRSFLLGALLSVLVVPAAAAQAPEGAILLIMDASGSMEAEDADGVRLMDGAKDALRGVVDTLPDGTHVGLRVYGHREPNTDEERGCRDTELVSPVQPLDRDAMHTAIDSFEPSGFTPIGASLQAAADDLPPEGPRTIILVSDGEDTCAPPDPCEVAADLRGDGVDLVVETVGFALGTDEAARRQLECIAEAGGGRFTDVATAAELAEELEIVATRDQRVFEGEGTPVEGQATTLQAPIVEPGSYTDSILYGETLFYGLPAVPGADYEVTVVREPDITGHGNTTCATLELVDRGTGRIASDVFSGESGTSPMVVSLTGTLDEDYTESQVYVHVEFRGCSVTSSDPSEYPLFLEFVVDGGQEPEGEGPAEEVSEGPAIGLEDEPDAAELAVEPAASEGLPTWAAVVMTLLVVLVLGLAVLVAVLFRRTSTGPGSPRPPA